MTKKWLIREPIAPQFANQFPEINPVVLQLLANRGITTQEKIDEFLNPDYGSDLHDPFLFIDMKKAVTRILQAIEKKEKIVVYGDYDADGVCSSAVMVTMLKALGADVSVYIPFRETEGYGLNHNAVKELIKKEVQLLITVDCGISNAAEIEVLQSGGVDAIITDHHQQPLTLPAAYAIINPNTNRETYPFKGLAGSGVAFKVAQGLCKEHHRYTVTQLPDAWEKWLLDLVAIGTVADMMPLLGENRTLVHYGLIVLKRTKRLGLQQLAAISNTNLAMADAHTIGFQIAPRLNAAGRLNHASTAYELLITQDTIQAQKLAEEINLTNQQRQKITEKITTEAETMITDPEKTHLLAAVGQDWPTGVVGLIAGRIADRYYRPTLVISRFNGELIGSGRSIPGFDITQALRQCDHLLSRYGGHAQACGFTLANEASLEPFIEKMGQLARSKLSGTELIPTLWIDLSIKLEEVTWELFESLEKFAPFGADNPKPTFLARNITVVNAQTVGQDDKHLRLTVNHMTPEIRKTIGFKLGGWFSKIKKGDQINIVFEIDVNQWNGNRELQLKINDLQLSQTL